MNAIGLVTIVVLLILVLAPSPRVALLGLIGGALYMTLGQVIMVLDVSIYPMRILTLVALMRVLVRGEFSVSELNGVDKALLLAYGYRTIVFIANGNGPPIAAFGLMVDTILAYFACRGLLRTIDDLVWFLRYLVILLVPYTVMLYFEFSSMNTPFEAIGAGYYHDYRNGWPRCMGSFLHPTIMGTFGASFIPLFIALVYTKMNRSYGIAGVILCLAIVFFSNSGGPVACVIVAVLGWLFWSARENMHVVRGSLVCMLIFLALAMKAPLWYLPAKLSALIGGDGWHRSYLMDVAFRALDQWWLAGMSVIETRDWFPYIVVTGGADIINYYLDFGLAGGIAAIFLFCFMLFRAYSYVGKALEAVREAPQVTQQPEIFLWALGIILTIHIFNWFALVYFDQFQAIFFMQLAILSTLSHLYTKNQGKTMAPAYS